MRNNWRSPGNATQYNPNMKVRAIDVVWETRRDAAEEELKMLLGVEDLDRTDRRCFQQRNAAAKLVLEKMSVTERAQMTLDLEKRREKGNPENIQR